MEVLKIIISGIIDGLTGFLPVSSSGHLAVLRNVFGFGPAQSLLFDALLKFSAILVIVFGFYKDVRRLFRAFAGLLKIFAANILTFFGNMGRREKTEYYPVSGAYRRLALLILAATVSGGIVGCTSRDFAAYAAGTRLFPGIFLVATGVMLFLTRGIPKGRITPREAELFSAFVIGGVQGLSVLPGLARCGMVITACLLFGYDRKLTFKFTFLSALPALLGAIVLDIIDMVRLGVADGGNTVWYILAAVLAAAAGYFGLIIVNKALKRGRFLGFSIYCLVLGAVTLASIVVM